MTPDIPDMTTDIDDAALALALAEAILMEVAGDGEAIP